MGFVIDSSQNTESVRGSGLFVSEAAPLASGWRELVSLVDVDVLDGVTEAEFVHAHAPNSVSTDLNDWQVIHQLFGVRQMGVVGLLNTATGLRLRKWSKHLPGTGFFSSPHRRTCT